MMRSTAFFTPIALSLLGACATTSPVRVPAPPSDATAELASAVAAPVPQDETEPMGTPPASATFGLGFTADPTTFLLGGSYDVPLNNSGLAVGPQAQLGVSDHRTLIAPTLSVLKEFDLPSSGEVGRHLRPFVRGGLGFAYMHKDHRTGDNDDLGFLINFGGGVRYWLNENVSLGSEMLLNFLPDEVLGEHFYFSWQVAQLEFTF